MTHARGAAELPAAPDVMGEVTTGSDTAHRIVPLQVGDAVPDWLWDVPHAIANHRDGLQSVRLGDFRDRLVILDFWATYCRPCVAGLKRLDSIGRIPSPDTSRYTVIPVTSQPLREIAKPLGNYGWNLFTIHSDSLLRKLLPHAGLPHQVWIRGGKVFAIPPPHFANAQTIDDAANGRLAALPLERQPFPLPGIPEGTTEFTAFAPGDPRYFTQRGRFVPQYQGVLFVIGNSKIVSGLFGWAYQPVVSPHHSRLKPPNSPGSSIDLEVSDSLRRFLTTPYPTAADYPLPFELERAFSQWVADHTFSYQHYRPDPMEDEAAAYARLRTELNVYFSKRLGIAGRVEQRLRPMAHVRLTLPVDTVVARLAAGSDGNPAYYAMLQQAIRKSLSSGIPLVDSTALANAHIHWNPELLAGTDHTLGDLNRRLARVGIAVVIREEWVPILVISETNNTDHP